MAFLSVLVDDRFRLEQHTTFHESSHCLTYHLIMTLTKKLPSSMIIPTLSVSFRGKRIEISLEDKGMRVHDIQTEILRQAAADPDTPLKLLFQGKRLTDPDILLHDILAAVPKKKEYKIIATGLSEKEAQLLNDNLELARRTIRIRDDLSEQGRAELKERQRLGQYMLQKSNQRNNQASSPYRFGRIETLPNLPDQQTAREILISLANDPGVLACMQSHQWKVGALAELYPEGKVGESEVCVMGLNENKGQRILLRIRTDDLQGFRKMASIRKVLYHELAHNVHSEHDDKFFQLMRQIERECTSMDWTHGAGLSTSSSGAAPQQLYTGGTYRLGGSQAIHEETPLRELAAQAALSRMTEEEAEIEQNCGCGRNDLFLPKSPPNSRPNDDNSDSSSHINTSD
jgi:hypothetical protein